MDKFKIILIENNHNSINNIVQLLSEIGYKKDDVFVTNDLKQLSTIDDSGIELILTCLTFTDLKHNNSFIRIQGRFPYTPIIVLAEPSEIEIAIKTLENGAQDYLEKGTFTKKEFEKAVRSAQSRKRILNNYRRLFDDVPAPMYIYDEKTFNFLAVNDAALHQYGYTKEEFLSMDATEIRPANEFESFKNVNRQLPEAYHDYGRWRHIRKGGEVFFVQIFAHTIEYAGRKARLVMAKDIDARVRSEIAVAEKSAEIINILESITDGFYALNKNWEITYFNKAAEHMLGRKRGEVIGKSLWEAFPSAREGQFHRELERAMTDRVSINAEEYYTTLGVWVAINVYPTKDGIAVYFVDITERKNIQEKLYMDGQNLLAIINNTDDIIWSIDTNRQIITANNGYWRRLEQITGKEAHLVTVDDLPPADVAKWQECYDRVFAGETFKIVLQTTVDGRQVFDDMSFTPIHDRNDTVIGASCFARDITEQQLYISKIEEQNEQLKQIAWIHSHELRRPVASILGLIPLFNKQHISDPINIEVVDKLEEATQQLDEIIKKITSYTIETKL